MPFPWILTGEASNRPKDRQKLHFLQPWHHFWLQRWVCQGQKKVGTWIEHDMIVFKPYTTYIRIYSYTFSKNGSIHTCQTYPPVGMLLPTPQTALTSGNCFHQQHPPKTLHRSSFWNPAQAVKYYHLALDQNKELCQVGPWAVTERLTHLRHR